MLQALTSGENAQHQQPHLLSQQRPMHSLNLVLANTVVTVGKSFAYCDCWCHS